MIDDGCKSANSSFNSPKLSSPANFLAARLPPNVTENNNGKIQYSLTLHYWINIINIKNLNFHFESFLFPKSEPSPCEAVLWKLVVNSANGINIINETKETLLINNGY